MIMIFNRQSTKDTAYRRDRAIRSFPKDEGMSGDMLCGPDQLVPFHCLPSLKSFHALVFDGVQLIESGIPAQGLMPRGILCLYELPA